MPMTVASISLGTAYAYYLGYKINTTLFALALMLKYRALGELSVFLAWGPLMALGSMVSSTGGFIDHIVTIVSIPVALLVVATLYANNVRDIERDKSRGAYTLAVILGNYAKWFYVVLLLGT